MEGLVIYEILSHINGQEHVQRGQTISRFATKHGYPDDLINSLFEVLLPETTKNTEEVLTELASVVLLHAQTDPLAQSLLSFLFSVGIMGKFGTKLELLVEKVSPDNNCLQNSIECMLLTVAGSKGSTYGILAGLHKRLKDRYEIEQFCAVYADVFGVLAEETASSDTFNELVGSSLINVSEEPSPFFLTPEEITADSDRIGYLISVIKENAELLRSAYMFGATDILDFTGIDEALTEEELLNSTGEISSATEYEIASELVRAIRDSLFNLHAVNYNKGVASLRPPSDCMGAITKFRGIISSQNLFVKTMFYFLKFNLYKHRDLERAFMISLFLSEGGVLAGTLNAIKILGILEKSDQPVRNGMEIDVFIMLNQGRALTCTDLREQADLNFQRELCLDSCRGAFNCKFAGFDESRLTCFHASDCYSDKSANQSQDIYEKISLRSRSSCWPIQQGCLSYLHEDAALYHNHTPSINWLMRDAFRRELFDDSLRWALLSAGLGDPEGFYYLGTLQGMDWQGHISNVTLAYSIFRQMLQDDADNFETMNIGEGWPDLDVLEHQAVRDIALQLGIPFDDVNDKSFSNQALPRKIAAVIGILSLLIGISNCGILATLAASLGGGVLVFIFFRNRRLYDR